MSRFYDNVLDKRHFPIANQAETSRSSKKSAIVMKLLCIFAIFVGVAIAEDCTTVTDCSHVTCPANDYTLTCDHQLCSCEKTTTHTCVLGTDCSNSAPGTANYCDREFHCVDSTCRCGHGFGPGPDHGHGPGQDGGHAPPIGK